MVFKKGHKINVGRKRPEQSKRMINNNPMKRKEVREKQIKTRKNNRNPWHSEETKKKIGMGNKGKNNGMYGVHRFGKESSNYGRKLTEEDKEHKRISTIKYIKKTKGFHTPRIGTHEKQILDELELSNNIKILRQYPICGYFVDGYCKELNLFIEVDEKHHKYKKQKNKDIIKENNINNKLNCSIIRIKDNF